MNCTQKVELEDEAQKRLAVVIERLRGVDKAEKTLHKVESTNRILCAIICLLGAPHMRTDARETGHCLLQGALYARESPLQVLGDQRREGIVHLSVSSCAQTITLKEILYVHVRRSSDLRPTRKRSCPSRTQCWKRSW